MCHCLQVVVSSDGADPGLRGLDVASMIFQGIMNIPLNFCSGVWQRGQGDRGLSWPKALFIISSPSHIRSFLFLTNRETRSLLK